MTNNNYKKKTYKTEEERRRAAEEKKKALENYATVNERLLKFRNDYPNGIIDPEIIKWTDDGIIVIQVKIYKTPEDFAKGIYAAKAHAYEKEGSNWINDGNALENCETSAVGRALAMMGYEIKKSIASREEVENAMNRREQKQAQPQPEAQPQGQQPEPTEKAEPIKPKTLGEIKTIWLRLGYTMEQMGRQLSTLYRVSSLAELTENQGQEFLKKLKDLEQAKKKQLLEQFKKTANGETEPEPAKKTA